MRKLTAALSVAVAAVMVVAVASPAVAKIRAELGCYGCALPYGAHDTWYTGCWPSPGAVRLEAKVDGRWVTYDSKSRPVRGYKDYVDNDYNRKQLVCDDPDYPWIMAYTFTVKDEGTIMNGGSHAGLGLLPFREVYTNDGQTKYRYLSAYVSFN
jgi:hypothetical protein